MKIIIVGGGGREHALCWKISQSPLVEKIYVAPGNAGTAQEPKTTNVNIAAADIQELLDFAKKHEIDLTVVGPEAPLALGIVDQFQQNDLTCFGPHKKAALLESSKSFCKKFLVDHHIPTARFETFTEVQPALNYLKTQKYPLVIKADGLAAGKGVVIAQNQNQAETTIKKFLEQHAFGAAGTKIIIEEFLQGQELSYIVIADGKHVLALASSQDHKRRDDGDQGPNTGGMGAFSPAATLTPELEQKILQEIIYPTIEGMNAMGTPYTGFLYAGLMVSPEGQPKVLEFNCRLGDPETQAILMRLQSDLVNLINAAIDGKLDQTQSVWNSQSAVTVVMAANGYPSQYPTGDIIKGLEKTLDKTKVFHAGTTINEKQQILTNGGRVLSVTALGDTIALAKQSAYQTVNQIQWPGCYYRKDIAAKILNG